MIDRSAVAFMSSQLDMCHGATRRSARGDGMGSVDTGRLAPMHTWPAWGRWLLMAVTWALLIGGFWLIALGGVRRLLGLAMLAAAIPLSIHVGRAVRRERSRTVE